MKNPKGPLNMKIKSRTIGDPASSASSSSGGSYLYWQLMEVVRRAATTSHAHAAIGSSTVVGVAIVVMSFGGVTASTVPNIALVNLGHGKSSSCMIVFGTRRRVRLSGVSEEAKDVLLTDRRSPPRSVIPSAANVPARP